MLLKYALEAVLSQNRCVKIYNTYSKTYKLTFFAQKRTRCANCGCRTYSLFRKFAAQKEQTVYDKN
jgi:hypothetical protein